MNIRRHLKRKKLLTHHLGTRGVTGVRMFNLIYFFDTPIRPIQGPFPKHLLILMREGAAAFRRDGQTSLAQAGGVLLVQAGEGSLEFIPCKEPKGLVAEVVEFDARSVAKHLRQSSWAERAALADREFPPSGVVFPGLRLKCCPVIPGTLSERFDPEITFDTLFNYYSGQTAPLARTMFYEARWKVLRFLEPQLWKTFSDTSWHDTYEKGSAQLERDCRFYVGCGVDSFVKKRKVELASAWLRSGCSIDNIARALGFASRFEFLTLYSAFTKRKAADMMNPEEETPLSHSSVEEFEEAVAPFWWRKWRRTTSEFPRSYARRAAKRISETLRQNRLDDVRIFERLRKGQGLHDTNSFANSTGENYFEKRAQKAAEGIHKKQLSYREPKEPTPEFREAAREFMEMKSTGLEIIVPFFKDSPVRLPEAA